MSDETNDASPPLPRRRGRKLQSIASVRLALADCLRALEAGVVDQAKARTLIYGYSILASVIVDSGLEMRVKALENKDNSGVAAESH